ncbi:MAG: polysaccharide lyase family protein [Bryobacteraceae bacterium]
MKAWPCAGIFFLIVSALPVDAETVWRIGTFDESSAEFGAAKVDYAAPASDPVFTVGQSDPSRDWLPFQPGPINAKAGSRRHPFTIRFDLPAAPSGNYELNLSLLAYSPRLPWLEVSINGHRGWFYQHPKLSYSAGDQWVFYLPYYSTSSIRCSLPLRFLKKGVNVLVLTALDEPGDPDESQPSGFPWPGTSGIVYDALALEHDSSGVSEPVTRVVPTIYYRRRGTEFLEVVDVFLRQDQVRTGTQAMLHIASHRLTQPVASDREFGEHKLEFDVPDSAWTGGEVVITSSGHTDRYLFQASPAKKWTLLLAPNVHLDIGYSDYDSKVAEIQSRAVDEAVAMLQQNPDFRFNLDGSWIVDQFSQGRSPAQRERFVQLVKENKILVPAAYASNFTGFATVENLIRSLYFSKAFARRHGTAFDFSLINDVPSYSWSYASVMAASGLRYFIAASDAYRAPFLLYSHLNELGPQWWEGPDGGRILTWYSRHYHQMASMFGLPPQVANGHDALPRFLQQYDRPEYKSDKVILFGTQVENTDLFPQQARIAAEWNAQFAYPKLEYAGFAQAMESIARDMGDSIPVVRGDSGPYWEDGMIANARLTAIARQGEHRILSAEKFSTISTLVNPIVRPDLGVIERAWKNLLVVDEHSWQADRSVTDPESEQSIRQGAVKDAHGDDAGRQIDFTLGRALAAIADYIDRPAGTLVVFNPSNWARTGLVETDIDKGLAPEVPFEVLSTSQSYRHVRFLAQDVPPAGYKCFPLSPAQKYPPSGAVTTQDFLESPFYRVALDPAAGSVRSIYDKQLHRELVDAGGPFRFDQYLYVTGADELPNRLVQYSTVSPIPKLDIHAAGKGRLVEVHKTPWGSSALLESTALNTPRIETEILLFDGQKRIEFINRIRKTQVYSKEAAYFAFPLAMDAPAFRYDTQNGFVDVSRDLLPGAGREWFNVQHWVAAEQNGASASIVPVDAPMVTLGDIARGTWPAGFGNRKGAVFSYVMANYTPEGYPAGQGGTFTFRYVFSSSARFSAEENSRLGWAALSPFELDEIRPNDKAVFVRRPLSADSASFLEIDEPGLTLVTWKLAEDGRGTILRLLETAGRRTTAHIRIPGRQIDAAWQCNAVEDDQQRLDSSRQGIQVPVGPFQIVTVRIEGTQQPK